MKTLNIPEHRKNLINILVDIYKDPELGPHLGFKGGSAALLFYNLPRFSTDLDFDLISNFKEGSKELDEFITRMTNLLSSKFIIKEQSKKFHTLFWLVSYSAGLSTIKVEVSTRDSSDNHYELKNLYGVSVNVIDIKDMIAHKMIALMDRNTLANRDLFDTHFFLGTQYANEINYEIIKKLTNKTPKEFYKSLYEFVNKIDPESVLNGLGEVLTGSQKDWAKVKLIHELKGLIQMQTDYVK